MEKKKERSHRICEKAPVVAMILSMIILFTARTLFSFMGSVVDIVVAIISLILIGVWFKPAFKGAVKPEVSVKEMLKMSIPLLVYIVLNEVIQVATGTFCITPTLGKLALSFDAGAGEEVMFRAAAIAIAMHYIKSEKNLTLAWLISSLIFGLSHISNVFAGAALPVAIVQGVATIFMGIFFASLYIRSGSIVLPILAHGVWDFIALSTDTSAGDNAVMTQPTVDIALVLATLTNVAVAVYAIWVMNKEKDKIRLIWEEKWSGDKEQQQITEESHE